MHMGKSNPNSAYTMKGVELEKSTTEKDFEFLLETILNGQRIFRRFHLVLTKS